jgi:hypothetical protein
MAIDFQRLRFTFPSHSGSAQSLEQTFVFPSFIRKAEAAINGFSFGFSSNDHHLFRQEVDAAVTAISLNTVRVRVNFALRDSSGFFDDRYDGFVDVMVIVDRV